MKIKPFRLVAFEELAYSYLSSQGLRTVNIPIYYSRAGSKNAWKWMSTSTQTVFHALTTQDYVPGAKVMSFSTQAESKKFWKMSLLDILQEYGFVPGKGDVLFAGTKKKVQQIGMIDYVSWERKTIEALMCDEATPVAPTILTEFLAIVRIEE